MKVFLVEVFIGWNGHSYRDKKFFALHHYALVMAENAESAEAKTLEALNDYVDGIGKASVIKVESVRELKCDGWLVLWKYDDHGEPAIISDVGAFDNASYSEKGECEEASP